jgi:predicted nucleic acid-binding protein
MRKVVVNTTPLIALSHVGRLEILKEMYGEIIIPKAVYRELSVKTKSVCKIAVDNSLDWILVKEIQNQMAKSMYKTQLHDGEVEVMILAKEINADVVIIDDANAKKHAKYLELPVTGTLGVLIKAKQRGYVDELNPILHQMVENGIYISQSLIEVCLEQVGEHKNNVLR